MGTECAHPILKKGDGFSAATLLACLRACGAAQLVGVFDRSLIDKIHADFRFGMADRKQKWEAGVLPQELHKDYRGGGMRLDHISIGGRSAGDVLTLKTVQDAADELLGHPAHRSHSSFIRTVEPERNPLPFHQDQTLLESPLLNIWFALTPCGVNAPGLEVALTEKTELLATTGPQDSSRLVERKQITRELVVETFGEEALWHPAFEPGDAMVFCGSTVHWTYVTPTMTEPRTSIELRLV